MLTWLSSYDTSILVGLLNPQDIWHSKAKTLLAALQAANYIPTHFDCAAAEAASALVRRLCEKGRAAEIPMLLDELDSQVPARLITWILPDVPRLYPAVLDLMRTSGGELNFNDALIALACRERDIPLIASFDPDFDHIPWLKRMTGPGDV
jgi:predicted nucleic acid-binding protein